MAARREAISSVSADTLGDLCLMLSGYSHLLKAHLAAATLLAIMGPLGNIHLAARPAATLVPNLSSLEGITLVLQCTLE